MSYLSELKYRLISLKTLKAVEEGKRVDQSQTYIDDLTTSIEQVTNQIKFTEKNGSGVEIVNGV